MRLARATLKSTVSADGVVEMADHIHIGDLYFVDLDKIQTMRWGQTGSPIQVDRPSIWTEDTTSEMSAGWMPLEMLYIPDLEVAAPAPDFLDKLRHLFANKRTR